MSPRAVERVDVAIVAEDSAPKRYWTRIVVGPEDAVPLPGGGKGFSFIGREATGALELEAGTFEMPPQSGNGKTDVHSHGHEEFSYIVAGSGWIAIEDERHHCQQGDFVFVPAFARHAWWNDGDIPLVVMYYRPQQALPAGQGPIDLRRFRLEPHQGSS